MLQARLTTQGQLPAEREARFQRLQQWLLGTSLQQSGYGLASVPDTEELTGDLGARAVPADLQKFLFRLKQQIVRELVTAVWIGPDGAGEIELCAEGGRIPIQVRATRPKTLAKSTS